MENAKLRCKGWRGAAGFVERKSFQIAAESRCAESKIGSTLYSNKSSLPLRTTIVRNVNIIIIVIIDVTIINNVIVMVMMINIHKKWRSIMLRQM